MKTVYSLPLRLATRIRTQGAWDTLCRASFLLHTAYRERRLGIDSHGFIPWYELSTDPDSVDYEAVGYRTLDRIFRFVAIGTGEDVFVDYGCGKGRPLVEAATYAFKRVVGVENSMELCKIARKNAGGAKRVQCPDIEVLQIDARQYRLSDDATVLFFFNPFNGRMLETVIENIRESLVRRPRPLQVVYVYPRHVQDLFARQSWLHPQHDFESEGLLVRIYKSLPAAVAPPVEPLPSPSLNSLPRA